MHVVPPRREVLGQIRQLLPRRRDVGVVVLVDEEKGGWQSGKCKVKSEKGKAKGERQK
jgi:hypothetical protein